MEFIYVVSVVEVGLISQTFVMLINVKVAEKRNMYINAIKIQKLFHTNVAIRLIFKAI